MVKDSVAKKLLTEDERFKEINGSLTKTKK
jgi:hypothetical protein